MKSFTVFFLILMTTLSFANTNEPVQAVHIIMDSMKNYIQAPKSGHLDISAVSNNLQIDQAIRKVFNYPHLIKSSLSPYWNKLSETQKNKLMSELTRVIELTAYPRGGYYFKMATVEIGKASISNQMASVPVTFSLKGTKLKSIFVLKDEGKGYQVIDYVLDGKSLIKLYRDQFSQIIRKKGISYFLKKVSSRYNLLTGLYSE